MISNAVSETMLIPVQRFRLRCVGASTSLQRAETWPNRMRSEPKLELCVVCENLEERIMETVESVMAEQLDSIIRRLNKRIDAHPAESSQKDRPSIRKLKKNLGQVKSMRAHFDEAK